ncbi:2-amino-4-hydroxy-6-hydroxymethyldihydropteridine diphosphokinase [Candidatus Sumerlaeota bacterium]|nr:2-amino-4-hydroxy-6-hydroxymethyldihydropteridine diphosphokinase [Candidatus Sumerlaeota bacterium]
MAGETIAYGILGSNLGDRAGFLRRAVFSLADTDGIEVSAASRVWETAPWGKTDQPHFFNAAVQLATRLDAQSLLDRFLAIEHQLGRRREEEQGRWGPRPVDLDLALYGDEVIASNRLAIPHPRLSQRVFALEPLAELAPDARDPLTARRYADILKSLRNRGDEPAGRPVDNLAHVCDEEDPDKLLGALREGQTLLLVSRSAEETERTASILAKEARGGEIVALVGRLGTGKTCFARGFARGLGIAETVTSPSYVLVKSYEGGRLAFHHADFYRVASRPDREANDEPDLASLGLEDYLEDSGSVILIEWADRFPHWLEPPFWIAEVTGSGDGVRFILLNRCLEAASSRSPASPPA